MKLLKGFSTSDILKNIMDESRQNRIFKNNQHYENVTAKTCSSHQKNHFQID